MINMGILKGIGKITLGAGAIGAGAMAINSGVNDIQTEIKAGQLVAASAAEASEDIDFGIEDDISGSEAEDVSADSESSDDGAEAEQSAQ